ncbi:adhesin [Actinoplanes sp. CA-015351]|uniref:adhesin n=1 Tax=Actinoplanes sp. CA-015351 TaxID=3239897 RepID=UPI003D958A84
MSNPMGGGWAAAGPADEDIAYRTQNLRFTRMELALDESVSFMALVRLAVYAAIAGFLVYFAFFLLFLLTLLGSSGSGGTGLLAAFSGLLGLGSLLGFVVFWLVLLMAKIPEPVAEWKTLIEGKAAAAESSYAAIYRSLARRQIPVGVSARRIRSDMLPESVNNRLIITERTYVAYISVFAFGTSLYVGWTMWRDRRGYALIAQFVKDLVGGMLGRTGIINQMLRTERVRATREAVHSAVREGVDAAVGDIEVPLAATFGYDVPVEHLSGADSASAMGPAGGAHAGAHQQGHPTVGH